MQRAKAAGSFKQLLASPQQILKKKIKQKEQQKNAMRGKKKTSFLQYKVANGFKFNNDKSKLVFNFPC